MEREPKTQINIELTKKEYIPAVLELIGSSPDALLSVDEHEIEGWIDQGYSFVAKTIDGRIIGHQSAVVWPQSGWVEVRAAVVKPEYRGWGINTEMKKMIVNMIKSDKPGVTIAGFTEAASKSRGILQRMGFTEIPLEQTPDEFFSICPATCVKKTGIDCGCKVFILSPEREVKDE